LIEWREVLKFIYQNIFWNCKVFFTFDK
jgi:hypothetical protein